MVGLILEAAELLAIMPNARSRVDAFLLPLNDAMLEFEITSGHRMAAFLAQIAHESGELRYVKELATGEAYEGRLDLGNTDPGDGVRYKGRGLLQITGHRNYSDCGDALNLDLVDSPELLEQPGPACRSAGWFWTSRKLNEYADNDEFLAISIKINGRNKSTGLPNGWSERCRYWDRAKRTLGV